MHELGVFLSSGSGFDVPGGQCDDRETVYQATEEAFAAGGARPLARQMGVRR
jgi:hypothetical protein